MKNKIKTFEEACAALNISTNLPDVSMLPEAHRKAIIAFYKLTVIIQALNEGWVPNWNDWNERKWWNWFEVETTEEKPSGFGFSHSLSSYVNTYADVGSRLCFKSEELADYARETFTDLYIDYLLLT